MLSQATINASRNNKRHRRQRRNRVFNYNQPAVTSTKTPDSISPSNEGPMILQGMAMTRSVAATRNAEAASAKNDNATHLEVNALTEALTGRSPETRILDLTPPSSAVVPPSKYSLRSNSNNNNNNNKNKNNIQSTTHTQSYHTMLRSQHPLQQKTTKQYQRFDGTTKDVHQLRQQVHQLESRLAVMQQKNQVLERERNSHSFIAVPVWKQNRTNLAELQRELGQYPLQLPVEPWTVIPENESSSSASEDADSEEEEESDEDYVEENSESDKDSEDDDIESEDTDDENVENEDDNDNDNNDNDEDACRKENVLKINEKDETVNFVTQECQKKERCTSRPLETSNDKNAEPFMQHFTQLKATVHYLRENCVSTKTYKARGHKNVVSINDAQTKQIESDVAAATATANDLDRMLSVMSQNREMYSIDLETLISHQQMLANLRSDLNMIHERIPFSDIMANSEVDVDARCGDFTMSDGTSPIVSTYDISESTSSHAQQQQQQQQQQTRTCTVVPTLPTSFSHRMPMSLNTASPSSSSSIESTSIPRHTLSNHTVGQVINDLDEDKPHWPEAFVFALGRYYQFLRRLAACETTVTYKALSKLTGQLVAIRISGGYDGQQMPKEVRLLNRVQGHPNICPLLGCHLFPEHGYFAMVTALLPEAPFELLFGRSVQQKRYMSDMLQGLEHMHAQGILYRDVKPGNFLWDERNQIGRFIDMDVSTFYDSNTLHRSMVGTREYYATEMEAIRVAKRSNGKIPLPFRGYDQRVDVYAAGVVFGQLLFGITEEALNDDVSHGPDFLMRAHMRRQGDRLLGKQHACWDLLIEMLNPNRDERISVSAALQHPWFKESNIRSVSSTNPKHTSFIQQQKM